MRSSDIKRRRRRSSGDEMIDLVHPVTIAYAISFASIFFWPTLAPDVPGMQCRDIASDWFNMIVGIFACAIAHSLYNLWILDRVVRRYSKHRKPQDPMLSLGTAIAQGGNLSTWTAYFSVRIVMHAFVTLVLSAAEHGCVLRYGHLLGSVLLADATLTFFLFAASWSMERLSKDEERNRKLMAKAAKATHADEKTEKSARVRKGEEKSERVRKDE